MKCETIAMAKSLRSESAEANQYYLSKQRLWSSVSAVDVHSNDLLIIGLFHGDLTFSSLSPLNLLFKVWREKQNKKLFVNTS